MMGGGGGGMMSPNGMMGRAMMSRNGNGTKQPHVGGRGGDVPAERRCGGMVNVTSISLYADDFDGFDVLN